MSLASMNSSTAGSVSTAGSELTMGSELTVGSVDIRTPDTYMIIITTCIFSLIILIGIIGNVSVIWIICNYSELRKSVMNIYIFNMALADLMLNLSGLPEVVQFIMDDGWLLGDLACKLLRYSMVTSLYVSILSLLAVTVERYAAIIHPMQAHALLTKRRITIATCVIWVVSICCAIPTAVFLRVMTIGDGNSHCILALSADRATHDKLKPIYKYLEFTFFFAIPLIVQVTLYILISKRLHESTAKLRISLDHTNEKQKAAVNYKLQSSQRSTTSDEAPGEIPGGYPPKKHSTVDWKSTNTIRSRQHVIRMLTACVVVYFLSYTPVQVLLFYDTFSKQPFHQTWTLRAILNGLGFINAAANPIIYCAFSQMYRSRFRVMYGLDKEQTRRARRLKNIDSFYKSASGLGSIKTGTTSRGETTHELRLVKQNTENDDEHYYNSQLEHSLLTGSNKDDKVFYDSV